MGGPRSWELLLLLLNFVAKLLHKRMQLCSAASCGRGGKEFERCLNCRGNKARPGHTGYVYDNSKCTDKATAPVVMRGQRGSRYVWQQQMGDGAVVVEAARPVACEVPFSPLL